MNEFTITRRLDPDAAAEALRSDVLAGFTARPKTLPPKWFYDARGSELFERITRLPEYYPTRAEREILRARASEIAEATGARTLIEFGSGSSEKTGLLIEALLAAGTLRVYTPVDVSESALEQAGQALLAAHPGLRVDALVADFQGDLRLPGTEGPCLVAFLGGTIGNLLPGERAAFLTAVRERLVPGDALLIGVDLVKEESALVAAYDDAAGVTAEFNKNVLRVIDRELGADLDPEDFDHVARWDPEQEWVEMRLRARADLRVRIPGLGVTVDFEKGEEIRTEVSAKFREEGVRAELAAAGLGQVRWWTDGAGRFGLSLSVPAG